MAAALITGFLDALERRRAEGRVVAPDRVSAAVVERLRDWGARRAIVPDDPLVAGLGIADALTTAGVEVLAWPTDRPWRELLGLDDAPATCAITVPVAAVARRGTLVVRAAPGHGRSMDAVGWWHLALLPSDRLVATLAEALTTAYAGPAPSAIALVSGPSRTSDIEKITTYGAHGALAEHVVVIDG